MATIYWVGGEDSEFTPFGSALITTTAGRFRSTYARCALFGPSQTPNASWWRNTLPFTATNFWFSSRQLLTTSAANANSTNSLLVRFLDVSAITRIRLRCSNTTYPWTFIVEKLDSAGAATQLGSSFQLPISVVSPDKVDIHINYAVAGSIDIYYNIVSLYSYTGDVTTNGVTSLSYVEMFPCVVPSTTLGLCFSEIIVADTDTRSWNLQTLPPVANGNTHDFDVGTPAASNVNEITLSDATLDGSTTNGFIDQYTIPAIAAGTYTITAIVVSARLQKGASGPAKMDLGVRVGVGLLVFGYCIGHGLDSLSEHMDYRPQHRCHLDCASRPNRP